MTPYDILQKLYSTEWQDEAMDLLFEYAQDRFLARDFLAYDAILSQVDFERITDGTVVLGVVIPGLWPEQHEGIILPSRARCVERAKDWFRARGDGDRIEALFQGFSVDWAKTPRW